MLQPTAPHPATSAPTQHHHLSLRSPSCPRFALTPLPSCVIFLFCPLSCAFPRKHAQKQCLNTRTLVALYHSPLFIQNLHHFFFTFPPLHPSWRCGPITNPLGCSAASLPGFSGSGFIRETPVSLSLSPRLNGRLEPCSSFKSTNTQSCRGASQAGTGVRWSDSTSVRKVGAGNRGKKEGGGWSS